MQWCLCVYPSYNWNFVGELQNLWESFKICGKVCGKIASFVGQLQFLGELAGGTTDNNLTVASKPSKICQASAHSCAAYGAMLHIIQYV